MVLVLSSINSFIFVFCVQTGSETLLGGFSDSRKEKSLFRLGPWKAENKESTSLESLEFPTIKVYSIHPTHMGGVKVQTFAEENVVSPSLTGAAAGVVSLATMTVLQSSDNQTSLCISQFS